MVIIQLIDSLGLNRGGLTKAIYERLTFVSTHYETILLVTGIQFDVEKKARILKANKLIPETVKVIGLFDHVFGSDEQKIPSPIEFYSDNLYEIIEEKQNVNKVIRYFNDQGQYVGLKNFHNDGILNFLEIHSTEFPHICKIRQYYDSNGKVRLVKYFDYSWKPRFETAFRSDGSPIYSCWLKEENGDRYRISYFDKSNGKRVAELCSDSYDLREKLLSPIIEEYPESIMISDEPSTILFLSRNYAFNKKIKKGIGYIHTTHTYKTSDGTVKLKPWYFSYKLNSGCLSTIISTNEIQAKELREIIPSAHEENVFAISHAIEMNHSVLPKKEPTGHLLFLGRLSDEKRVDLVIEGFSHALKCMPHLILDIVGDGPLMDNLKSLVNELGISKSVIFHGYTLEVNKWFQKADCHFLTSKFEGFPLVLIEGLVNACPCIVSPCKYGPDQIIEHETNGLRVEAKPENIGKAILKLYKHNLLQNLSVGALNTSTKYDKNIWKEKWLKVLMD
ncbi:glycosyltransferase [Wielerella bovis]|uniref:glycosyltransferase n=1 Tax=Wielerella bovis TaxID=2917790 RepID=UPI002018D4E9|nr:glycosyltransferase [Wielerella bovis]ULJ65315.1 glycosyltransferase [Wielerella bovis]ULJ67662.1 glycosyltransferase [Wielerella bovis]